MSDVPETPNDGAVEAAEAAAVDTSSAPASTPPWGEDFNAERAWSTIQTQRAAEERLQAELKSLRSDPDAAARFVAEHHGWEFDSDEPEYDDTQDPGLEDDPYRSLEERLEKQEQWRQQQEMERTARDINDHIAELAKGTDGVKLSDRDRQIIFQQAVADGQISPASTERAFNDHLEWLKSARDEWQRDYLESKRGEMPPPTGTAGEAQFDRNDPQAREARMAAILQAHVEGEGS